MVERINNRQSEFALTHVAANRFAHFRRAIIEHIVAQLEADAYEFAELCHALRLCLRTTGRKHTKTSTDRKQTGSLSADDVEVSRFGKFHRVLVLKLQQFALGKRLAKPGYVLHNAQIVRLSGTLQRLAQNKITGKNSNLVGE